MGRTSTETLLGGLGRKIARAYKKRGIDIPVPDPEAFKTDPYAAFRAFVDDIEDEMDTDRQAVVLIDEFEVLESKADQKQVDRDIFPFLRSLLQHASGMAFLLAGTRRLDDMKSEYWSVFYGLVRDKAIGYLQQSEMRQLVTQPLKDELEFDDLSLEAIYRHTAGHPYYAQLICQTIVNEMNALAVRNDVTMDDVSRAAQSVISLGGGQLLHEWKSIESPSARAVLAAAAEIADNAAAWIERSDIVSRLKKENYQVEGRVFDEALEILRKREIVTTPSADGPVKLRLDLLRQWLRRERPLKSALSEAIP